MSTHHSLSAEGRNSEVSLETLAAQLKQQSRDLEEIKLAIAGNTKLGIKGFVKTLESHDTDITYIKNWINKVNVKVAYTSGLVAGGIVGGIEGLKSLIEYIRHH